MGIGRPGQPSEKCFQCVELEELVDRPTVAPCLVPQVEVRTSRDGCPSWRAHNRTSSARRSAGSARGKFRASSIKRTGLRPGRPIQRRSASHATSEPSR